MKTYAFESLDTWQCARKLAVLTYAITADFPTYERFGLTSQMRRAAISVCSNLAEGTAKLSANEKARFTEIAYGSLMELMSQAMISRDLAFISDDQLQDMRVRINEIAIKASRLRESQLKLRKL